MPTGHNAYRHFTYMICMENIQKFTPSHLYNRLDIIQVHVVTLLVLSSALKPGAHFFENNKITGVFTMLQLCVSKERLAY